MKITFSILTTIIAVLCFFVWHSVMQIKEIESRGISSVEHLEEVAIGYDQLTKVTSFCVDQGGEVEEIVNYHTNYFGLSKEDTKKYYRDAGNEDCRRELYERALLVKF